MLQLLCKVSSSKVSVFPHVIRNYRPHDFDDYVRLNVEAEKLDPGGRCTSPKVLGERLGRPSYHPQKDLFIAEVAGKVIGYIDVTPELGIGRVVLECLVHPQHRRKGLAKELSYYAIRRARELGVQAAHVNIAHDNAAAKNLLSKLGLSPIRRFFELRLQLSKSRLPDVKHTIILCRHLQCGEEDKLALIQNRSFVDSWGYNPNTTEEIVYRVNLSNCSPNDVILASREGELIGYCWTRINIGEGASKGQIYMLGVDPDYRGRGIGKSLLLAGLSYLKSRGVAVVGLTVDSQNTAACALYESVGFEISSTTLWYGKVLD